MKIAVFIHRFTYPGKGFPNWFEYWQKSAVYNREIDFFIPTNIDFSQYKKYDNIHYIYMTEDELWRRLDKLLGFKVYRGYYKTAEYRVFWGILFQDIIQEYDYWGTSDFDVIYGNIMKYIRPYIDRREDIIGKDSHFRLIKNTDQLRYLPFEKVDGFEHPLNYKTAFSTEYCWYFDESGMNLRYRQAGINVALIDKYFGHIHEFYKYFLCVGKEGKWGFWWENGNLIGYNDLNESREFMYIHFTRRKMLLSDDASPGDTFCIVPNKILNNCKKNGSITPGTLVYTWGKKFNRLKMYIRKFSILSADDMLILIENAERGKKMDSQGSYGPDKLRKLAYKIKKLMDRKDSSSNFRRDNVP